MGGVEPRVYGRASVGSPDPDGLTLAVVHTATLVRALGALVRVLGHTACGGPRRGACARGWACSAGGAVAARSHRWCVPGHGVCRTPSCFVVAVPQGHLAFRKLVEFGDGRWVEKYLEEGSFGPALPKMATTRKQK